MFIVTLANLSAEVLFKEKFWSFKQRKESAYVHIYVYLYVLTIKVKKVNRLQLKNELLNALKSVLFVHNILLYTFAVRSYTYYKVTTSSVRSTNILSFNEKYAK